MDQAAGFWEFQPSLLETLAGFHGGFWIVAAFLFYVYVVLYRSDSGIYLFQL